MMYPEPLCEQVVVQNAKIFVESSLASHLYHSTTHMSHAHLIDVVISLIMGDFFECIYAYDIISSHLKKKMMDGSM